MQVRSDAAGHLEGKSGRRTPSELVHGCGKPCDTKLGFPKAMINDLNKSS